MHNFDFYCSFATKTKIVQRIRGGPAWVQGEHHCTKPGDLIPDHLDLSYPDSPEEPVSILINSSAPKNNHRLLQVTSQIKLNQLRLDFLVATMNNEPR